MPRPGPPDGIHAKPRGRTIRRRRRQRLISAPVDRERRRARRAALDFEATPLEDEDFVYADPPYDVEFTHYSKGGFGWHEQVRTAEWLARHKGPVILANQATPRIVALYRALDFTLTFVEGPRRIACTGDRTPAREVLAFRNLGL